MRGAGDEASLGLVVSTHAEVRMSDIPPELIDRDRPDPKPVSRLWSVIWFVFVVLVVSFFAMVSCRAAALDRTDVYCELFQQDPDNGRYYIAADPPWTPDCANPWVTLRKDKFQTLVDTYEGGSSSTPQFTADEVAAIKYQLANPSPFNLSLEDGAFISVSIGGVWVIAWGFKQLGRFGSDDPSFE
jgi:hypothetical protein